MHVTDTNAPAAAADAMSGRRLLLLTLMVLPACDGNTNERPTSLVRDSAGIAIVDNPAPDTAAAYALSGPVLEIGTVAGSDDYELHDVRAVVRMSDGGIAIANGGTEIIWYDADGRFRQRAGGEGDGPGEFSGIRYMRALPGDSLLVFDGSHRRVTVFAPDGSLVRDQTPRLDAEQPATIAGALRDGTLLSRTVLGTPPAATALFRSRHEFAVLRGDSAQSLRSYPGSESELHASGSGGGASSIFISTLPFGRAGHVAAGPEHFFIGSSDSFQIDVWDATARLIRIIRVDVPVVPVTEELRRAYIDAELDRRRGVFEGRGRPFDEADARRELQAQRHAPAVPAFGSLLATADGGLWVKAFVMPGADAASQRWMTFDPDGRLVGVVDMPSRFTPMHVQDDVVTGVSRDSLDVPRVHSWTFRPTNGQARALRMP